MLVSGSRKLTTRRRTLVNRNRDLNGIDYGSINRSQSVVVRRINIACIEQIVTTDFSSFFILLYFLFFLIFHGVYIVIFSRGEFDLLIISLIPRIFSQLLLSTIAAGICL